MVVSDGGQPADDIGALLAGLWAEQRGSALERVAVLEDAAAALAAGGMGDDQREAARSAAHKLRGSSGTYGFHHASEVAGELEDLLAAGPVDVERTPHVASLVLALRTELEGEPSAPTRAQHEQRILVISDDPALAGPLVSAADAAGSRRADVVGPGEAADAARAEPPALVLLDAPPAGSPDAALALLTELRDVDRDLRIVVLAGTDDLLDRVDAVQRGARGFIDRSLPAAEVLATAEHFAGAASRAGATVLAVDDDPAVLAALRALLEPRGFEYVPLSEPTEFWERLEEVDPDLAVIDIDMPRVDGLDICRAVRSDPAWAHLPLLILTAYRDPEFMRSAFAAGADDFVAKPIEEEELVARITNRLERVRAARESTGRDNLTGLPTRQRALAQIAQVLAADPGTSRPVALIAVRGLELLNERAGQRAGDDRLRELAASMELAFSQTAGRYGGATFVALLPPSAGADPGRVLAEHLDRILGDRGGLELVAALGHATPDTLDATLRAAEQALKQREGPRIRIVGDATAPGIDVVYVEDEDSVADVLRLALDTLGLGSKRLEDGTTAAAALTGNPPELRARVVLLDWDLPGLDGLSVLRQLAGDGVLESTRVIMLTARAGEDETVRALELGAFDFVSKPFSVPVLVERLRVALER